MKTEIKLECKICLSQFKVDGDSKPSQCSCDKCGSKEWNFLKLTK